jgi:predicted acyl esterase
MPWFQHGASPELPGDQRADDGKSICFDSTVLTQTTEIFGTSVATLTLSVDKPTAFICVRLCDVAPNGASTLVSYGVFNLTHINGAGKPVKLALGRKSFRVTIHPFLSFALGDFDPATDGGI